MAVIVGRPQRPDGDCAPMNLPLLAPHVQLAWRDERRLVLEDPAAPHTHVLVGNAHAGIVRWLRSCDGTRTLGAVLDAAAHLGIARESAEELLGTLVQTGLLTLEAPEQGATAAWDVDSRSAIRQDLEAIALAGTNANDAMRRRQEHRISIEGTSRVAHALIDVLASAHIGELSVLARRTSRAAVTLRDVGAFGPTIDDVGHAPSLAMKRHIDRLVRPLSRTHFRPLVIACDSYDPEDEMQYQQAGMPYLRMLVTSRYATIGPLTLPGHTVCWSCIAMHRTDADPDWPSLLAQFEHHRRRSAPVDSAFAIWVASETATHVLRVIDHDDPSPLINTTLHFDRREGVFRKRHWTVHRECPCQWQEAA